MLPPTLSPLLLAGQAIFAYSDVMALAPSSQNPAIADFLSRNHVAVLATAYEKTAVPHAAAIYYTVTSKLDLFFVTKKDTTKSRNLRSNPIAALVIYESSSQTTAQVNGTVQAIDDPEKLKDALAIMAKFSQETAGTPVTPISRLDAGDYVLYELTPQNIRLAGYKYNLKDKIFDVADSIEESIETEETLES